MHPDERPLTVADFRAQLLARSPLDSLASFRAPAWPRVLAANGVWLAVVMVLLIAAFAVTYYSPVLVNLSVAPPPPATSFPSPLAP
jgi:hypothetical protein